MKKISFTLLAALVAAVLTVIGFAGAASATGHGGGKPSADNKKVTLCHATSSETNPYTRITVSVAAFYSAGHIDHVGDIWEAFSYTDKKGRVVNVPAQGGTSLLAFEDCAKPRVDKKIAKPSDVFVDKCGTEDDVFSVAPGEGYSVGQVRAEGSNQVITVSLLEGFAWAPDGNKQDLRFVRPAFTDEDCDLPETGGEAIYNTAGGIAALAGIFLLGAITVIATRRKKA